MEAAAMATAVGRSSGGKGGEVVIWLTVPYNSIRVVGRG
jgi:hypothetical protein